jgi:hypothetical protein
MRLLVNLALSTAFFAFAFAAERKIKMEDLPQTVQNAVKEQTTNARLIGLSKEIGNGQTQYEAEAKVNGRSRVVLFDKNGAVVEVEEETALDSIPAAARVAISEESRGRPDQSREWKP